MIETRYRVSCDGEGCWNCTEFHLSREYALREAAKDGFVRVKRAKAGGGSEYVHHCHECARREAAKKAVDRSCDS